MKLSLDLKKLNFKKIKSISPNRLFSIIEIFLFLFFISFLVFISLKVFFIQPEKKLFSSSKIEINLRLFEEVKEGLEKKEIKFPEKIRDPFFD